MKDDRVTIGPLKISVPNENQAYFGIFEDLAELFGKEFQHEAVKELKSNIREVKPKPSIDSEADYTSIHTTKVETLLPIIETILKLSIAEPKFLFDEEHKEHYRKLFTAAKKNRPKPKPWQIGDVFVFALLDQTYCFGQVLANRPCTCTLYDVRSTEPLITVEQFAQLKPLSILHLGGDLLNKGQWKVLFNEKVTLDPAGGSGGKFGEVGSSSYGGGWLLEELANVYWGLMPWNVMYDEDYYKKKLLKGIDRPPQANVLSATDRAKYREEILGIAPKL